MLVQNAIGDISIPSASSRPPSQCVRALLKLHACQCAVEDAEACISDAVDLVILVDTASVCSVTPTTGADATLKEKVKAAPSDTNVAGGLPNSTSCSQSISFCP